VGSFGFVVRIEPERKRLLDTNPWQMPSESKRIYSNKDLGLHLAALAGRLLEQIYGLVTIRSALIFLGGDTL